LPFSDFRIPTSEFFDMLYALFARNPQRVIHLLLDFLNNYLLWILALIEKI